MGAVHVEKEHYILRNAIRQKFIMKLEGKTIDKPLEFVQSEEGQKLLKEAQNEAETFFGYTLAEAKEEGLIEDLAHEIKWKSKKTGEDEMTDCSPESIM